MDPRGEVIGRDGGAMSDELPYGVKIFADGADLEGILELARDPAIAGFTTNPTLMRKSGIDDYPGFARKVLDHVTDKPISFEVLCDEFDEMADQARRIASWGPNVFVKIPVTNTRAESAAPLIRQLSAEGLQLNVTAILAPAQIRTVAEALVDAPAADRVGVRRSRRRHRARPRAPHDRRHGGAERIPAAGAVVGEPPRDPQRGAGGRSRLSHHHRDPRVAPQAEGPRPKPGGRLARTPCKHVPRRRRERRLTSL